MVDSSPTVAVALQNEPNPWVGITAAESSMPSTSLRTDFHWAWARPSVASGPIRSGRPTLPNSSEPPVNTASSLPSTLTAYETWWGVSGRVQYAPRHVAGLRTCRPRPSRGALELVFVADGYHVARGQFFSQHQAAGDVVVVHVGPITCVTVQSGCSASTA